MNPAAATAQTVESGAESVVAKRGRPREFINTDVLEACVQLFWEQGYEATSMADIVAATGLSKSSLYNTFGSKDELFSQALERYVDQQASGAVTMLTEGTGGLDDLHVLLDGFWAQVSIDHDHRGCLAINTLTELGLRDDNVVEVGTRFRGNMRDGFRAALQRAADLGEIKADDVDGYAALLLSFMLGTAVIVRSGAPDDEILGQLDAARAIIDGWRIS